jgi:hypothetical protein
VVEVDAAVVGFGEGDGDVARGLVVVDATGGDDAGGVDFEVCAETDPVRIVSRGPPQGW